MFIVDVDVSYSVEQMDGTFNQANSADSVFDRSISSTRVVGVYKNSNGSVSQMSIGAWDPEEPDPVKVLTQIHHTYDYWATYNDCGLAIDKEGLVDYGGAAFRMKATDSSYGQKVGAIFQCSYCCCVKQPRAPKNLTNIR